MTKNINCDIITMYGTLFLTKFFKVVNVRADVALPDIPRSWRAAMLKTAVIYREISLKGFYLI